jgi:hypothetical protein
LRRAQLVIEIDLHPLNIGSPPPTYGGLKLRSMKSHDDEPALGHEKSRKPSRSEEARRIVQEYADDLREILKKLRKLFN